jgi:hypothetical protein
MRPSYANVTSTLALVVALGGTSYAAIQLPRDSVRAKHIADRAVRSAEIRDGAVTVDDLAGDARGITRIEAVEGLNGHGDCSQNCEGPKIESNQATCPTGTIAVGGGVDTPFHDESARVITSEPTYYSGTSIPNGWTATVGYTVDQTPAAIPTPQVHVICAS